LNAKISLKTIISQDKIMQFERDIRLITQTPPSKNEHKKLLIRSFIVSLLHPFISSDIEEYFNNFPTWFNNFLAIFHKVEYMTAGLSKIMSRVNYDSKYLCHVFKNYMGVTMTEYLNDIRLNYSLSLLQNTSDTVSKIANSVGFSSVSHFNVIFKKKFGITPKDLRKKQISVN
jgi:AraC-like DNA-binding protein